MQNTEEIKEYCKGLGCKDIVHWETIERRNIFRGLRNTLIDIGIPLIVPMNLVDFTHEYCKKYGDSSVEKLTKHPREYFTEENTLKLHTDE